MAARRWVGIGSVVALATGVVGLLVHEVREARASRALRRTAGRLGSGLASLRDRLPGRRDRAGATGGVSSRAPSPTERSGHP